MTKLEFVQKSLIALMNRENPPTVDSARKHVEDMWQLSKEMSFDTDTH